MFVCKLKPGSKVCCGSVPDGDQVGVEWLELERLNEYRIYPRALCSLISADGRISDKVYLGDVN